MERRGFLAGILAAGFAPAFVGANVLMPVRQITQLGRYPVHVHVNKWPIVYHNVSSEEYCADVLAKQYHGAMLWDDWIIMKPGERFALEPGERLIFGG